MALDTASSSRSLTASSRLSTPFLTRARNSATVAVTAAIVYAASSNAFISRFPVMIQTAAGSHITCHQRRMRQDGRASSKGRNGCTWMVALQTYHDRWTMPGSVIAIHVVRFSPCLQDFLRSWHASHYPHELTLSFCFLLLQSVFAHILGPCLPCAYPKAT